MGEGQCHATHQLVVAPEQRCSPYDADDSRYPQSVEDRIVAELGGGLRSVLGPTRPGPAADPGTPGEREYRMAESRRMSKSELFTHFAERFGIKRAEAGEFFDELQQLTEQELLRCGEFVLPSADQVVAGSAARSRNLLLEHIPVQLPKGRGYLGDFPRRQMHLNDDAILSRFFLHHLPRFPSTAICQHRVAGANFRCVSRRLPPIQFLWPRIGGLGLHNSKELACRRHENVVDLVPVGAMLQPDPRRVFDVPAQ